MSDTESVVPKNPQSLEDFGYKFNEEGKLVQIESGKGFEWQGQEHYDALGNQIICYIQKLMKEDYNLEEHWVPVDRPTNSHIASNIFLSKNALTTEGTLLVLIQGSGAVRPGQWARSLCINDSLENGTILPYLKKAEKKEWETIVLNPNQNIVDGEKIPGNASPEQHTNYVWDHFISKSSARNIVVVAHSYAGNCMMDLWVNKGIESLKRINCVAFTDSVHHLGVTTENVKRYLKERTCNWIQSDQPLDTVMSENTEGCRCVSAGHTRHEYTSAAAIESVFGFLEQFCDCDHFEPKSSSVSSMPQTPQEKIQTGNDIKNEGNQFFIQQEHKKAISKYKKVFLYTNGLDSTSENAFVQAIQSQRKLPEEVAKQLKDLTLKTNLNLAACYLALEQGQKGYNHADKALEIDPQHPKGLFRRGQANVLLREFEAAKKDLQNAQVYKPDDKAIKKELKKCKQLSKEQKQKDKEFYQRAFNM
eukprot:gb/GECH01013609.1/.p1 GENE.gb/GECH01013609.1/~~gb/GECH01013609.1/.p1  ORF type:complete len:476 (+),score=138.88 gb/GECH01013609.1/:1-1428(+)